MEGIPTLNVFVQVVVTCYNRLWGCIVLVGYKLVRCGEWIGKILKSQGDL